MPKVNNNLPLQQTSLVVSSEDTRFEMPTDCLLAIDLGVYSLLNLIRDVGPYIGPEEDLTTVGRGIWPP